MRAGIAGGIALFLLLPFFAAAQTSGQRFALVIGNSDYRHVDSLPNTAHDASDIAQKLSDIGYTVDLRLNSDLAGMGASISAWIRRLSSDRANEGFFWYAGHGIQAAGENYLLPVDINAEDEAGIVYGSYPLGRLLLSLEQTARNKLNVVVLDACRDNPFKNLPGGTRGLSRGFVTVEHPPQDIFVMFSTAPGTVAADGEGSRNSPFTEAFLRYMDSGEILPVMAGLVTRETMRLTGGRQRPYQNGSIVSDLYYSLGGGSTAGGGQTIASGEAASPVRAVVQSPPPQTPVPAPAMVLIPAGTFVMGSPAREIDRDNYREISHTVELNVFYLSPKELSVGEFRRFVEETGHVTTAESDEGAFAYNEARGEWEFRAGVNWKNPGFRQTDDHPVVCVSWFDAVHYCNWLSEKEGLASAYIVSNRNVKWNKSANGYRLPTEAEWEYACRAGTTTPFATGARISTSQANYDGNFPYNNGNRGLFRRATMPAGSFQPNAWGIYDMHGNVWEWCWDFFGMLPAERALNPSGPDSGEHRVSRGGDWASAAMNLRSAFRDSNAPETAGSSLGFRLARNQ